MVFSKSKSSDVSHSLRDFDFLCLPLQTLISAFYIFLQLSPFAASLYFAVLKTAFKLKGFFLYFFLLTFFPVKPENEQGRRTSLEKFTRSVVSSFYFPYSLSSFLVGGNVDAWLFISSFIFAASIFTAYFLIL